ncbi:MAG: hypothetical protein ABIT83_03550 [Massilia sp.]
MRHATWLLLLQLLCAHASAQTVPIGRLFSTPAERERIDRQRGSAPPPAAAPAPLVTAEPPAARPAPPPIPVTVDGIVRRSGGKTTVWLNQVPTEIAAGAPGAYAVPLPAGGSVLVKPGQSVDPASAARKDLYAPR